MRLVSAAGLIAHVIPVVPMPAGAGVVGRRVVAAVTVSTADVVEQQQ